VSDITADVNTTVPGEASEKISEKKNLHLRHDQIITQLKLFCEDISNYKEGPLTLFEISQKLNISYGICSRNLQMMSSAQYDPRVPAEKKFSQKVRVWKKGNGIFVWYNKE